MKRLLASCLLTLAHCGGDGSDSSTVALELSVPAGETRLADSDASGDVPTARFVGGDGEATFFWSESPVVWSRSSIVARTIRSDLVAGEKLVVVASDMSARWPVACRIDSALAVSWTERFADLPVGITLNEADVEGAMTWPGAVGSSPLNDALIGPQEFSSIACLEDGERVVAWRQFDATNLSAIRKIVFRENEEPEPDVFIVPTAHHLACDRDTCIVTWALLREEWEYDYIETEILGVFARAFYIRSGEMGTEILLSDGAAADDPGSYVASTGDGEFLFTIVSGDDTVVRRLVVE